MITLIDDLTVAQLVLVGFVCCLGSLLIGAVGLGGVVIVPTLLLCNVPLEIAIVSVFVAFTPATFLKLLLLGRLKGLIPWRVGLSAGVAATIGSAAGGQLVKIAPRRILAYLIAAFALTASLVDVIKFLLAVREKRRQGSGNTQGAGPSADSTQGTLSSPGQEQVENAPTDGGALNNVNVCVRILHLNSSYFVISKGRPLQKFHFAGKICVKSPTILANNEIENFLCPSRTYVSIQHT